MTLLLLHTQAQKSADHPPPNNRSQQPKRYKNFVCSLVQIFGVQQLTKRSVIHCTADLKEKKVSEWKFDKNHKSYMKQGFEE